MTDQGWNSKLTRPRTTGLIGVVVVAAALASPGQARAGDIVPIATLSGTSFYQPDDTGGLDHYASGVGASLAFMEIDARLSLGFEISTLYMAGEGDQQVYDLGLSFITSWRVEDRLAVPFMLVGLDVSGVDAPDLDRDRSRRVMTGIHAGAGLHGFLGEDWYWRGQAGFLGAGPGGVTGGLSLGYVFR